MTRAESAILTLFIVFGAIVWGVRFLVWLVRR